MRFPSIKKVAAALREVSAGVYGECDVRLQVYSDGGWAVRWGLSDYDQDHRGYWGAGSVPGVNKNRPSRFNSTDLARDLIEQVREQFALDPSPDHHR